MTICGVRVDGAVLHVSILGPLRPGPTPDDPTWRGYRTKATETDDTVLLGVRELLPLVDLPPGHGFDRAGRIVSLPVRLGRPLDGRAVIDRATGSAVPMIRDQPAGFDGTPPTSTSPASSTAPID